MDNTNNPRANFTGGKNKIFTIKATKAISNPFTTFYAQNKVPQQQTQ